MTGIFGSRLDILKPASCNTNIIVVVLLLLLITIIMD
jgi:hypothetical protein